MIESTALLSLRRLVVACPFALTMLTACDAFAWGEPHLAITKAALDVLPPFEQQILGTELAPLGASYCLIPDHVFSEKDNAKYAMMDDHPGEVYLTRLHLPEQQPGNYDTLRFFIGRAVASLKEKRVGDAARYMGTVCHLIEDFGSPSHTVPGDNQFDLIQQFLPPTDAMKDKLLHGPIENGTFAVSIGGYHPLLLGTSVDEAAWRLLHRVNDVIVNARSTTVPIIQALYAGDEKAVVAHQLRAATMDAKVTADALHTILCLGADKLDTPARDSLQTAGIAHLWPLEAENLFFAQSQFFSAPYWGHAHSGFVLESGVKAVPLKLRVQEEGRVVERAFADGISAGMGKPLTFLLPRGVFTHFTVLAGLHAGLGAKGRVDFTILGDDKPLASATVGGADPAAALNCDVSGVSRLKLAAVGRGIDPKSNHAIWATPLLHKAAK